MNLPSPPDPQAFYEQVWLICKQIPAGRVTTYGQIASMIPPPAGIAPQVYQRIAPRWVGDAMTRAFSEDMVEGDHPAAVPWQRGIIRLGRIAMREGGHGYREQMVRLEAEAVEFDSRDRVDFNRFGWEGPPQAWLTEHGFKQPKSLRAGSTHRSSDDSPEQLSLFP
ncbi:MAG: MGMT family protein [Anaerolineae bacterium]